MVQSRQLRKSHDDAHYCAALFRYEREQSISCATRQQYIHLS